MIVLLCAILQALVLCWCNLLSFIVQYVSKCGSMEVCGVLIVKCYVCIYDSCSFMLVFLFIYCIVLCCEWVRWPCLGGGGGWLGE